jgi:hypothetical protein
MPAKEALTRADAVHILNELGRELSGASTKAQVLNILQRAGTAVGYKPAFRCLVKGETPEESIHW